MSKIHIIALMPINLGGGVFLRPGDQARAVDEKDGADLIAMGAALAADAPPSDPPPVPPKPEETPEPVPPPQPAAPPPTISRPRR